MSEISTKKLRRKGSAVLLEYQQDGETKRVIVPASEVEYAQEENGKILVSEEILDQGIPYGVPWELIIPVHKISPEDIARNLRSLGIWTYQDVLKNPEAIMNAVFSCSTDLLANIQRLAKDFRDQI